MAYPGGFGDFIKRLEKEGELRRVSAPVDPVYEITEIADRQVKSGGSALLFENVIGSPLPVAIGCFATMKRMAIALGVGDVEEIAADIARLVGLPGNMPQSFLGKAALLPELARIGQDTAPKTFRGSAPCQEIVRLGDDVDLAELPVLKCWPLDGGRFITLPLVFTKDAATGKRNVGMYRVQIYDRNMAGMHWQRHKVGSRHHVGYELQGREIPVAVVLGRRPRADLCRHRAASRYD